MLIALQLLVIFCIVTFGGLFFEVFGDSILDWIGESFDCVADVFFPYDKEFYGMSTVESLVYEINNGMIPYTSQDSHGVPLVKIESYHQFDSADLLLKCYHKNGSYFFVTIPYHELLVMDYLKVFKLITSEMVKYKDVNYCVEILKRELLRLSLLSFCTLLNANVTSPQFMPACTSATRSAEMQSTIGPEINNYIDRQEKYYQGQVLEVTGQYPWYVASGLYMGYAKHLTVATGMKPVCDSARIEISTSQQSLNLSWNF